MVLGDRRLAPRWVVTALFATALLSLTGGSVQGAVTLIEAGHTLNQIVDSAVPLHPSQAALDSACAFGNAGNVESVGVDAATGTLYIQISSGGFSSFDTCIFAVSPAGVATPLNLSTGFGINSRGTDLHFDPTTSLLVTQDQNTLPEAIATVAPGSGLVGTYSDVTPPFIFGTGTFGMDFSAGTAGSDVPAGDIIFTSDLGANGIHSALFGGIASTTHVTPPSPGDDMVVQPDGDWVHVPDFLGTITAYGPAPPHPASPSATGLSVGGMFSGAGLPFIFGSRATVCDTTGDLYLSYSGSPGGSGIFRVDEPLMTATLVLTVTGEGVHDLTVGPSSSGTGNSVYFTVHDPSTLGEELWEVTTPECAPPNQPPDCSTALAEPDLLWPPNHKFQDVVVAGVTDPDGDPVSITVDAILQDEPLNGKGDGNTTPDGGGVGTDTAQVRAERSGKRDGRVYHLDFTANDDQGGSCSGTVSVCVPHDLAGGGSCVDQGPLVDSTGYGMASLGRPSARYSLAAVGLMLLLAVKQSSKSHRG